MATTIAQMSEFYKMNTIFNALPEDLHAEHPDAAYWGAWALLVSLDRKITGGQHLRATDGQLITTLDQLTNAILENRWPVEKKE